MEIYKQLLEDLGHDCSSWELATNYEELVEQESPNWVMDYQMEMDRKYNMRYKAPYKRLTHFKEHLQRIQGNETVTLPKWLVQKLRTYPGDWKHPEMYHQVRKWMKLQGIHRKYYEHIFSIAIEMGGYQIQIPHSLYHRWIYCFPTWDKRYRTRYGKKNFPSYYVLLHLLLEGLHLPYSLPSVSQRKYNEIYCKLYNILFE